MRREQQVPHLPGRRRLLSRTLGCALAVASACLLSSGTAWADSPLTTDAGAAPLVSAMQLSPGHVLERCVVVSTPTVYTSADLGLFVTASGPLADHLNVTVETGSGGSFDDCTGFTGRLVYVGTLTALANGFDVTRPERVGHYSTDDSDVTLRLRFSVQDDNSAQGLTTTASFWWLPVAADQVGPPPTTQPPAASSDPVPTTPPAPPTSTATAPPTKHAVTPGSPPTSAQPTTAGGSQPVVRPTPTLPRSERSPSPAPVATTLAPPVGVPLTGNGGPTRSAAPPVPGGGGKPPAGIVGQLASGLATGVANAAQTLSTAAAPALKGAAVTSLMILPLVLLFLLVQRWFDRRDPKLALAPSYGDPFLGFLDRHRLHDLQGESP